MKRKEVAVEQNQVTMYLTEMEEATRAAKKKKSSSSSSNPIDDRYYKDREAMEEYSRPRPCGS